MFAGDFLHSGKAQADEKEKRNRKVIESIIFIKQ
tara:strand:+ start:578 stop:679 length:102 start_codon:yes stop_codon:yes gene_type:complete